MSLIKSYKMSTLVLSTVALNRMCTVTKCIIAIVNGTFVTRMYYNYLLLL